jgi:small subunit ribosomal protein S21
MAMLWNMAARRDRAKAPAARKTLISLGRQAKSLLVSPAPQISRSGAKALQIIVRDNNIDQALKALKKKMQREGIFREMKLRGAYEKPSEKRARERAEAVRRYRKLQRKRLQREGLLPR